MFELCTIRATNIFLEGTNNVHKNFCVAIILSEKPLEKIIINLILASWKVICYSREKQIEDFN